MITKLERVLKNGRHLIFYENIEDDKTGLGGEWQGGGTFAEIFEVGEYFVLQNACFKPFAIFKNTDEIDCFLKSKVNNGTENQTANKANRVDPDAAPVRLIAFSEWDF